MTETLQPMADEVDPQHLAEQLLAQAKAQGVDLVGLNGLLNQLTRNVLETALEAEMTQPRIRQARSGRADRWELA